MIDKYPIGTKVSLYDDNPEALDGVHDGILSPQERIRITVMATGNKWAMENFNATHN